MDTVYSLKDEVQELKQVRLYSFLIRLSFHVYMLIFSPVLLQDNKRIKRSLEEEQRARKELERIVRRVLKNMNDPTWDETNL